MGGNIWAGGTGGRDTAGLGGKGGPYRLDAGHDVHQIPDWEKEDIPEEVRYTHTLHAVYIYSVNGGSLLSSQYTHNKVVCLHMK